MPDAYFGPPPLSQKGEDWYNRIEVYPRLFPYTMEYYRDVESVMELSPPPYQEYFLWLTIRVSDGIKEWFNFWSKYDIFWKHTTKWFRIYRPVNDVLDHWNKILFFPQAYPPEWTDRINIIHRDIRNDKYTTLLGYSLAIYVNVSYIIQNAIAESSKYEALGWIWLQCNQSFLNFSTNSFISNTPQLRLGWGG